MRHGYPRGLSKILGPEKLMSKNMVESIIGALVLIVAGGFFWFTYDLTEMGTVEGYELVAIFDSADGLDVGSDVKISGIKVGTVIGQSLNNETFEAVVHFTIKSGLKLTTDSSATIASEGLLGSNYLAITTGAMDEFLEAGDSIEFTQGSVSLMDLIGQAIYSVSDDEEPDE